MNIIFIVVQSDTFMYIYSPESMRLSCWMLPGMNQIGVIKSPPVNVSHRSPLTSRPLNERCGQCVAIAPGMLCQGVKNWVSGTLL